MESKRHFWLKHKATQWLLGRQWMAVALEVALPTGRFRADVAGWSDRLGALPAGVRTVIVEAKVSRADFLRDAHDVRDLLERRSRLHAAARAAHVRIPALLRSPMEGCLGEGTLFEGINGNGAIFDTTPARDRRRLRLQLLAVQRRLREPAKFAHLAWWRAADELWIATPTGLVRRDEVPTDWGLVEFDQMGDARVRIDAPDLGASSGWRQRVLRNIAIAGTRAC